MKYLKLSIVFFCVLLPIWGQNDESSTVSDQAEVTQEDPSGPITEPQLDWESRTSVTGVILPEIQDELIYIEGESAVATNFNQNPTLDYASSGSQMLQLNRYTGLNQGAKFFSEYVFNVEEGGNYELWYGGTPPGPRDELFASYASPFEYQIDSEETVSVYREDMAVVEQYTVVNYWNRIDLVDLEPGIHTIKIFISEKRRYDGKYYFYLDSLFLLKEGAEIETSVLRHPFPTNLEERSIDNYYRFISEYEARIQSDPENLIQYLSISSVYSLIGDYQGALKYLNRGLILDPENKRILLLLAKNRIWKGDVDEGLNSYQRYLDMYPDDLAVWAEYAKICAWVGRLQDALEIYTKAMEIFPDSLSLQVNRGLTLFWDSQVTQAERALLEAEEKALEDVQESLLLADIYRVNGYQEREAEFLEIATGRFPKHVEFELSLGDSLRRSDRQEDAEVLFQQLRIKYTNDPEILLLLDRSELEQTLRERMIQGYRDALTQNPDDLSLRDLLVQALFWNGRRTEAITENENILANYLFRTFKDMESRSGPLLLETDSEYLRRIFAESLKPRIEEKLSNIREELEATRAIQEESLRAGQQVQTLQQRLVLLQEELAEISANPVEDPDQQLQRVQNAQNQIVELQGQFQSAQADQLLVDARFIDQQGVYAQAFTDTESFIQFADNLLTQFEVDSNILGELEIENQEEKERLNRLTELRNWEWNRAASILELNRVLRRGTNLGAYNLARIYQMEDSIELAQLTLQQMKQQQLLEASVGEGEELQGIASEIVDTTESISIESELSSLQTQVSLWKGDYDLRRIFNESYSSYVVPLENLRKQFTDEPKVSSIFNETMLARVDDLNSQASELLAKARTYIQISNDRLQTISSYLYDRLLFTLYLFDETTYLIRFQLGDYYLSENRLDDAEYQFQRVIQIDPWNQSAQFKLATVEQLSGDWYGAIKRYRQIFAADPDFENVISRHNQLSRQHADKAFAQFKTLFDTQRTDNILELLYSSNFSSNFGFDIKYMINDARLHTTTAPNVPSSLSLHQLSVALPISIPTLGLKINPRVGLDINNRNYELSIVNPTFTFGLVDFLSNLELAFLGELGIDFQVSVLQILGNYRYTRIDETFLSGRDTVFAHQVDTTVNLYFDFPRNPSINFFSSRSYLGLDFRANLIDDTQNLITTFVQDLNLNFHLGDVPWTNLGVFASFLIQDSQDTTITNYFVPDGLFVPKGGLQFNSWPKISNDLVLGLGFRLGTGAYIEQIFDVPVNSFLLEGSLRFDFILDDATYFLDTGGSVTVDSAGGASYWSLSLTFGIDADFPHVLAP